MIGAAIDRERGGWRGVGGPEGIRRHRSMHAFCNQSHGEWNTFSPSFPNDFVLLAESAPSPSTVSVIA